MDITTQLQVLDGACLEYKLVGSRVTCNPPPVDTDQDVLVLASAEQLEQVLLPRLGVNGFEHDGSDCGDPNAYLQEVDMSFQSFSLGDMNLIVTLSPEFYRRFNAATSVAKLINVLDKTHRIALFQAVLYGNIHPVASLAIPLPPFPVQDGDNPFA